METPDALDKISDRQERQGAKLIFKALKTQYTELAKQYENGQDLQPNKDVIKKALTSYHAKVQIECAEWQYDDLQRRNPTKGFQMGTYERILSMIRAWITLNIGGNIKSISDTTKEVVQRVIAKGQQEGFGARKIGQLIRAEAKGEFTVYRSTLIARTEGTRAASQGAKFGAEQWEKISGQKKWKVWSAANQPNRTRDQHLAMIGTDPIPGDQDFIVGGKPMEGPGDPRGGKANVIACRCRMYFMSERMARQVMGNNTPVPQARPSVAVFDDLDEAKERQIIFNKDSYGGRLAIEKYSKKVPELHPAELVSINAYTDSAYDRMNKILRDPKYVGALQDPDYYKALVNQANRGLDKMPKYNGVVYRGVPRMEPEVLAQYKRAYDNGDYHTELAFMSTSPKLQESFGTNIVFQVKSKTGVHVKDISEHKHEDEVLFKARSKFRVTKFEDNGSGQILIEMEED